MSIRMYHKYKNCSKTFLQVVNSFHYVLDGQAGMHAGGRTDRGMYREFATQIIIILFGALGFRQFQADSFIYAKPNLHKSLIFDQKGELKFFSGGHPPSKTFFLFLFTFPHIYLCIIFPSCTVSLCHNTPSILKTSL